MFRSLRRKSKEISIEAVQKLLKEERRGVLAVNGDDNYPYAVPVNFYFDESENKIYFHGAKVGYKVEALKKCDKVCFTVYGNETVKDEEAWAPYMQSVVIFGRCHLIEDGKVAGAKLKQFAMKYYPDEASVDEEISLDGKAVQMFEIEIENMCGKEIQEK